MIASLTPGVILVVGGLLVPLLRASLRPWFMLLLPLLTGAHILFGIGPGLHGQAEVLGHTLVTLRVDTLALAFGGVFTLAALLNVIYGWHERDAVQQAAALIYAGASVSAAFAGDLITLFVFWELTSIASAFLIWASRNEDAFRAGMRYLIVQVGSGLLLLGGIILHQRATGSMDFGRLDPGTTAGALIFVAFGIKAAFPLMNNWLPDGYSRATVLGSVVLSAFTTKMAIYALARAFPGTEMLIWIGAVMAVYATLYALIENDFRKLLAYSLNSQLGFMVVGIGIGTPLALAGTAAHALASVLYQALLFMAMGAVLLRTGTVRGSDLGGLARSMPLTALFCIVGAAAISAMPLTSGFVSKSLILSAATREGWTVAWLALLVAAAGTVVHSGIRLPYHTFFGKDRGLRCKEAPGGMLVAMAMTAALCILIGVLPGAFYRLIPGPVAYDAYTVAHVVTQIQFLLFPALAYAMLLRNRIIGGPVAGENLDSDWIYRRFLPGIIGVFRDATCRMQAHAVARNRVRLGRFIETIYRHHGPQGALARTWPVGSTVLWVAVLLCVTLVFYYVE